MQQVGKHKVVSLDYTLTNAAGEVLDTSQGSEPLAYLHGTGTIIPGLEEALEGKAEGDQLNVVIPAERAYGERNESLVQQVPRSAFGASPQPEPGMQFQARTPNGSARVVTVVAVQGDTVTVDANHPLAGVELNFDVTVVGVRDATAEEVSHGHVHGPGGHQH